MAKKNETPKFITINEMSGESDRFFNCKNFTAKLLDKEYIGDWHIHDFFELELLLDGKADMQLDDNRISAKKGDCWLCLPGSVHRVSLDESSRLLSVQFNGEYIESSLLKHDLLGCSVITHLSAGDSAFLYDCVMKATNAARDCGSAARLAIKGLTELVTAFVISKVGDERTVRLQTDVNPSVLKAVRYSKLHISENLTVKAMAERLGYVPNYFSTLFKNEMGISYTVFLTNERLRLANILLKNSEMVLSDIAKATGFETAAYFCRVYKKIYGKTPSQFKKS